MQLINQFTSYYILERPPFLRPLWGKPGDFPGYRYNTDGRQVRQKNIQLENTPQRHDNGEGYIRLSKLAG